MTMICDNCGRAGIRWMGPLTDLTHTECPHCGGVNCQRAEFSDDDHEEGDEPYDAEAYLNHPRPSKADMKSLGEGLLAPLTGLHLDAWVLPNGRLLPRAPDEPDEAYRARLIYENGRFFA